MTQTLTATIAPEPADVYHADTDHVSASMLKCLADSPQKYYERYVLGALPDEDTEALRFGRAFHSALLEPDDFRNRYVVAPKCDRRTKDGKQQWSDFCEANKGRECIDVDMMATLIAMQAAVRKHAEAKELLDLEGKIEHAMRWEHRCWRKARPDKIIERSAVIVDLKTVSSPTPLSFASAAAKWGWFLQDAHYRAGAAEVYADDFRFLFVCIGKTPPHEVAVHEIDPADAEWAEGRVEELVTELLARKATGKWLAGWQVGINKVPLPAWIKSSYWSPDDGCDSE